MADKKTVVFCGFRKCDYPNLGVAYLVSNLREHGFDLDYRYFEAIEDLTDTANKIIALNPMVVGLTATSADFNAVISLSKKIKSKSDAIVLLGGAHITSVPQTLPKSIDIGVLGEAEEIIVDLFELIEKGPITSKELEKVSSVAFFDDTGKLQINERRPFPKNLDAFPKPARDIFDKSYWETGVTSILTSRGCPYHCAFCQVSAEWRICRYHSADYVVDEIQELVNDYGIHTFGVIDDLFIANKKRLKEIVEKLREVGLLGKVRFAINGRANLINDNVLQILIEMNTAEIALGLESMSPRILTFLKDKVTIEDNYRAVDLIYKYGLKAGGLYMIGTPSETLEDMAMTYDYVAKNRYKFGGMQVCITTPLPNTRLWDLCVEHGKIDPDINKLDWDKLNVAAENINTNLYVGDLDAKTFIKVLRKFRKLFFNPGSVEYENSNYIEAGCDESKNIIRGNYSTETWSNGDVFWTDGHLEAVIQPEGNEDKIALEFFTGKKKGIFDRYNLKLRLIDNETQEELLNKEFDVRNSCWCTIEFDVPLLHKVSSLKVILESDIFYPSETDNSSDTRQLSIALKKISLKQVAHLLPLNGKKMSESVRELGVAVKEICLKKFTPLIPLTFSVKRVIKPSDGVLSNFHEDQIWTNGESSITDIVYKVKEKDSNVVLYTKGWHPFKGDLNKLAINIIINGINQEFSHNDDNAYYFRLDKSIKVINEIKILSSTFSPKSLNMNEDTRELGIDFDCIRIT